jgi:rSAM/selenodomain-associated transferase 2/rSAM/selenodomain-associated transferase 1
VKVSVVVPALDEEARLSDTLAPLARLRDAGHEVIVVDGGSSDRTRDIAASLADRVLVAPRGRAIQMNTGAAVASGEHLLFLHADCRLPASGVAAIEGTRLAGRRWGRFDVRLDGRSPLLPVVAALINWRSAITGICTGDQGMFVEHALFEEVGGFPPIPLMEDVALCKTLRSKVGRPKCVTDRIEVSARRWDQHGALRTIAQMWALRFAYWRGASPHLLARRYYGRDPLPVPRLQVFAKPPVAGLVKRRLAVSIGDDAALAVYRDLLLRTLRVAAVARRTGIVSDVELWVAPDAPPGPLASWGEQHGFALKTQSGADLGERMRNAARSALEAGMPAIIVGTDAPDLDIAYLARASAALQAGDAVIGPAEDGGYVLIGVARELPIFSDIPWSTPAVLERTRERLRSVASLWTELPTSWDVDTAEDYARLTMGASPRATT